MLAQNEILLSYLHADAMRNYRINLTRKTIQIYSVNNTVATTVSVSLFIYLFILSHHAPVQVTTVLVLFVNFRGLFLVLMYK